MSICCDICCDDYDQVLQCIHCKSLNVCKNCILKWGKPFCINCNNPITDYQLSILLTKEQLDNSTIGNYWKTAYIKREEKIINKIAEISREKCPLESCNNFLSDYYCLKCNIKFCDKCMEKLNENHKCNEIILMNMKEIKQNTKACPNCSVKIFKSEGCDHMRCTNCGTYFTYSNTEIQQYNSNPIKNNEIFGNKICNYNINFNNLEINENPLIEVDPYAIYFVYNRKYKDLYSKYRSNLQREREKFIESKIRRDKWIESVYKIENKYKRDREISNIIVNYLIFIEKYINNNYIDNELFNQLNTYNKMLLDIQYMYGGVLCKFNIENKIDDNILPYYNF